MAFAPGEEQRTARLIDALPPFHPFEIRYSRVERLDWESCSKVLDRAETERALSSDW